MIWIVLGMLLAVVLAAFVLATVAVPAHRAGRPMFTPRGAKLFRVGGPAIRPARSKPEETEKAAVAVGAEERTSSTAKAAPQAAKSTAGEAPAKNGAVKIPTKTGTPRTSTATTSATQTGAAKTSAGKAGTDKP